MKRIVMACVAMFLVPWLSGCCCCGTTSSCGGYSNCVPYGDAYTSDSYGPTSGSRCSNCNGQVADDFSLPPLDPSYPVQ